MICTFSEAFGENSPFKETSFHNFEEYQLEEATQCIREIKVIDEKLADVKKRLRQNQK